MQMALTMVCVWPSELPVIGRLDTILTVSAPLLPAPEPLQFAAAPGAAPPAPERPLQPASARRSAAPSTGAARQDARVIMGSLLLPAWGTVHQAGDTRR